MKQMTFTFASLSLMPLLFLSTKKEHLLPHLSTLRSFESKSNRCDLYFSTEKHQICPHKCNQTLSSETINSNVTDPSESLTLNKNRGHSTKEKHYFINGFGIDIIYVMLVTSKTADSQHFSFQ